MSTCSETRPVDMSVTEVQSVLDNMLRHGILTRINFPYGSYCGWLVSYDSQYGRDHHVELESVRDAQKFIAGVLVGQNSKVHYVS